MELNEKDNIVFPFFPTREESHKRTDSFYIPMIKDKLSYIYDNYLKNAIDTGHYTCTVPNNEDSEWNIKVIAYLKKLGYKIKYQTYEGLSGFKYDDFKTLIISW